MDKCLCKANHFPQEEGSCLHSSCGGRAKRRRLTHPALKDTQGPRGEEQVSGAEMARSLLTSSKMGLLSPAPAPVSYTPSGLQNPPPLANHYNAAVSGNLLSPKVPTALQGQCNKIFVNKVLFFFLSAHEVKGFSLHLASFSTERQSGLKHTGNLVCLAG